MMKAMERLFITADKTRLVAEGDPAGAKLYAAPGDEIPESAVALFGIVDGKAPRPSKDKGGKQRDGGEDKSRKGGSDKDRKDGDNKDNQGSSGTAREASSTDGGTATETSDVGVQPGSPHTDDLTMIHGIGAKTAAMLAAAGTDSFAKLAAIDAANPPDIEGLNPRAPWGDWVKAAAELAGPVEPAGGLTSTTLPKEE